MSNTYERLDALDFAENSRWIKKIERRLSASLCGFCLTKPIWRHLVIAFVVLRWLQLWLTFFELEFIKSWAVPDLNQLFYYFHYFSLETYFLRHGLWWFSSFLWLCFLIVLIVGVLLMIAEPAERMNENLKFFIRIFLLACITILNVPIWRAFTFTLTHFVGSADIYGQNLDLAATLLPINITVSVLGILIYGVFGTFLALCFIDTIPEQYHFLSQAPSLMPFAEFCFSFAVSVLRCLMHLREARHFLLLLFFSYGVLIQFVFAPKRFQFITGHSLLLQVVSKEFMWTSFALFCAYSFEGMFFQGSFYVWLFGSCLLLLHTAVMTDLNVLKNYDLHNAELQEFLDGSQMLLGLLVNHNISRKANIRLESFFNFHKQKCSVKNCGLTEPSLVRVFLIAEYLAELRASALSLLEQLFQTQLDRYYSSCELRFRYVVFLLHFVHRNEAVTKELMLIDQLNPSLQYRFLIGLYSRMVQLAETNNARKSFSKLDQRANSELLAAHTRLLHKRIENICTDYVVFWTELLSSSISLNQVRVLGFNVVHERESLAEYWTTLDKEFSYNNPVNLILYGKFLIYIAQSPELGRQLIERAAFINSLNIFSHQDFSSFSLGTSIANLSMGSIIISGGAGSIGIVREINAQASSILSYFTDELVGLNINKVIPEPLEYFHDQYVLKSTESKKVDYFKKEREVYAKSKLGYLVPVRVIVKPFFGNRMLFASKIASSNHTTLTTHMLVDHEGRIITFSSTAILMLRLSLSMFETPQFLDEIFPSLDLFGRREELCNETQPIDPSNKFFKSIEVGVQQLWYAMQPHPLFLFLFSRASSPQIIHSEPAILPPVFRFTINSTSNRLLATHKKREHVSVQLSRSPIAAFVRVVSNYGEGIRLMKLSQGMVVNRDNYTHESEPTPRESAPKITLSSIDQKNSDHLKLEDMAIMHIKSELSSRPLPFKVSHFFALVLFAFAVVAILAFTDFALKNHGVRKLNEISIIIKAINSLNGNFQESVFYIVYDMSINSGKAAINGVDDYFDKSGLLREMETTMLVLDNQIDVVIDRATLDAYGEQVFHFEQLDSAIPLSYRQAVSWLFTQCAIIFQLQIKQVSIRNGYVRGYLLNVLNEFWINQPKVITKLHTEALLVMSNFGTLIILEVVLVVFLLAYTVLMIALFRSFNQQMYTELSMLNEISTWKIKHNIKICDNFIYALQSSTSLIDMQEMKPDSEELSNGFTNRKKKTGRSLQSELRFNIQMLLQFAGGLAIVLSGFFLFWSRGEGVNTLFAELNTTAIFKSEYELAYNSFLVHLFDPSLPVTQANSKDVLIPMLNRLSLIDINLNQNQMLALSYHSDAYQLFTQKLLLDDSCRLLSTLAVPFHSKTMEDCISFDQTSGNNYMRRGLALGLTKLSEDLRTIVREFFIREQDKASNTTRSANCSMVEERFCVFDSPTVNYNLIYVYTYLKALAFAWNDHLISDIINSFLSNAANEIIEVFTVLLTYFLLVQIIMLVMLLLKVVDCKKFRKILQVIPIESLLKSQLLQKFFHMENYEYDG